MLESAIQPRRRNSGFEAFAGSCSVEAAHEFEFALETMRRVGGSGRLEGAKVPLDTSAYSDLMRGDPLVPGQ